MTLTVGTDTYVDGLGAATYCNTAGLAPLGTPDTSLKQATLALDRLYGGRYIGLKAQLNQPLAWPRRPTSVQFDSTQDWYVVDSFGNYRDFTGVPPEVVQATVELAVLLEAGTDPYAQPTPAVIETSVDVGVKQALKYQAGYVEDPLYRITTILSPVLSSGAAIRLVR